MVTNDAHPEKPGERIEAVRAHNVIVVPQRGRILVIWIMTEGGSPRPIPILWRTVTIRLDPRAVKMDYRLNPRRAIFCSAQTVINRQEMLWREAVHPFHQESLAAPCFKCRARKC